MPVSARGGKRTVCQPAAASGIAGSGGFETDAGTAPVSISSAISGAAGGAAVDTAAGSAGAGLEKSIFTVGRGVPAGNGRFGEEDERRAPDMTRAPGGN